MFSGTNVLNSSCAYFGYALAVLDEYVRVAPRKGTAVEKMGGASHFSKKPREAGQISVKSLKTVAISGESQDRQKTEGQKLRE